MKSIFRGYVIAACFILLCFCLSGCSSSLEGEVKDLKMSSLIKVDSGDTLGKVLSRYSYAKNIYYKYEDTDMAEYQYITIELNLEKKEYAPIIKTSPGNVQAGVILKFAKTRTTTQRRLAPFPGSQVVLIVNGKDVQENMNDYLLRQTFQQLFNNEPITAPFKALYRQ
jgi:hypothetical protein